MARTRRRRRPLAGLAAAITGVTLTAGCVSGDDREAAPLTDPTAIRQIDPGGVPGLSTVTLGEHDARIRLFAGYPRIAGAEPLNGALAGQVDGDVRPFAERAAGTGPRPPDGAVPELNVEWSLAAASGDVVGVRLVTARSPGPSGSGGGETRRTIWYDGAAGASGAVRSSADLVNGPSALSRLASLVAARVAAPAVPAKLTADPRGVFSSLGFNGQGDLVTEFSDGSVAPAPAGRVAVVLGHAAYEPLLSPFGRRARDAALAVRPELTLRTAPSPPPDRAGTAPPGRPTGSAPPPSPRTAPQADCRVAKCVALTFDDGPGPDTGRLLDMLAERDARATFFVVGANAAAHPALLRGMHAKGHEIGNHTHAHRVLARLPALRINSEIQRTQEAVRSATGRAPTLLRPPYGEGGGAVARIARSQGLAQILWNGDGDDLADTDPRAIADRVVSQARPGGIVRLHDVRAASVDAVPAVLDRLDGDGFRFVTVSALLAGRSLVPGSTSGGR
ncbi:polysaccharide deacetylase family protein [Actinomadura rugatobispora]|uniref:polysaccharide deacetylase family protein n=1 Tax=Actinomadura rugatobispora TaxID=1994 RepID=UPI00366FFD6D